MKKLLMGLIALTIFGCSTKKTVTGTKQLFEILTQQSDGGANIKFYEILTEPKEIRMLQGDANLREKISQEDLSTANFIILNMGEKTSGGYSITVDTVQETEDSIIVNVKENEPASGIITTTAMTYPYAVVKINSKKQIVIK